MNTLRTMIPALVLTIFAAAAQAQSVWLEAECGQVGSLWNRSNDGGASNSQYVVIQPGNNSTASAPTNTAGHIAFPIGVTQGGTYTLFARVLGPTANDDSYWVSMDGGSWVMWNNWWTTSWAWKQFPNTFNLTAGNHTLTLAFREDGAQLDKLSLSTSSTVPTGTGSPATNCSGGPTLSVSPTTVNVAAAANGPAALVCSGTYEC